MQGFNTWHISQGWHDDDRSLWKSRFGYDFIDYAIQSKKLVTIAQEGDRALPALEKEYRTTDWKSDALI